MKTWETNAPEFQVTILNHSNIEPILKKAGYPLERFYKLSLPHQKDVTMAAVLSEDGGIFMDVDMIILDTLQPVYKFLEQSEAVLFSNHLSFIAAKPEAIVTKQWADAIRQKLNGANLETLADLPWDFVGNSITNSLFKSSPQSLVSQLDKHRFAYTPETIHFSNKGGPGEQYRRFWFESHEPDSPFYRNQFLIALHNSWTPEWYSQLSEHEVLKNDCLLSSTLKIVLNRTHYTMKKNRVGLFQRAGMLYYTFKK